jgi:hypothetical protein
LPRLAEPFYASPVPPRAKRNVLLELNVRVHEAARRFEGAEPGRDPWDFTCECGATECRLPVSLTLADYESLRAAGRPLLAKGHETVASGDKPSSA